MSFSKRLLSGGPPPFVNDKNFRAVLYTGNGGTQSITGVGFQPDFVWLKNRSQNNYAPRIFDSSRGATKRLQSSHPTVESTDSTSLTSFDADGFTLGSDNYVNNNGDSFVAWCWKAGGGTTSSNSDGEITVNVQANQDAGFSIVTFAGISDPGDDRSFAHGLSQEPEFIWMKRRESAQHLAVFAKINGGWEYFDGTSSTDGGGDYDSYIATTSTLVDIHDAAEWFADTSSNYVYWMWHSVAGYSKFGTYTGDRPNDVIVQTGFEVGFVMIKSVDATDDWFIIDSKRGDNLLYANKADSETSFSGVTFLSNGFMLNGSQNSGGTNNSGTTFLYMAFAVNPDTEAPTLASSFNTEIYKGTGSDGLTVSGIGFKPGLIWIKNRGLVRDHNLADIVLGPNKEITPNTNEAVENRSVKSFDSDGFTLDNSSGNYNANSDDYVAWTWKADDNVPTFKPASGKKVSLNHGASNYLAVNAVSGSTGKYYFEVKFLGYTSANTLMVGLYTSGYAAGWQNTRSRSYYANSGKKYKGGTPTNYGATFTTGDTVGVAVNGDDDEVTFYKNGTSQGLAFSGNEGDSSFGIQLSTGLYPCTAEIRFTSSEWQYSPPSGFTQWTAAKNAYDNNDITSSGAGFIYDNFESIVSVNSNAGFSIVKYEGTGNEDENIPHGLSAAPEMIMLKNLEATRDWIVWHTGLTSGANLALNSNTDQFDVASGTSYGGLGAPTASNITFIEGTSNLDNVNDSGVEYIAYCFHSVTGYSKFGTYTGNGSATGPTVTTGFKVDWLMIKRIDGSNSWAIHDSRRVSANPKNEELFANLNDAENEFDAVDFLSNGFQIKNSNNVYNASSASYLYWAVAKNVPSNTTLANSFKTVTYSGTGNVQTITGTGFRPDFVWLKGRSRAEDSGLFDTVRGPNEWLRSSTADAQNDFSGNYGVSSFGSDGFTIGTGSAINNNGDTYVGWAWKAGNTWQSNLDGSIPSTVNANTANGFSIVKYTGTGSATTVGHGLGAAPEMIIVKNISNSHSSNAHWAVYHTGVGHTKVIYLNRSNAEGTSSAFWNDTAPTSSVFSIGTDNDVNVDGEDFIAYCWDSVSGFSSIGTYTGNGSTTGPTVTTGFQPDFLLVKDATNASTNWRIVDSVRGTDATDGSALFPNLDIVEQTDGTQHAVEFQSNGFQIRNSTAGWNNNSATHIYMAFKMN